MSEFRDFREAPRDIRTDSTYARPPSNFYDYHSHQRQSHVPPIPQPSYDTTFGDAEYMIVDTNEGQAWDWQADMPLHDPGSQKNPAMGMVRGLVSGLRRFSKVVSTTQEHLARNSIFHRDPQANRRTFPRYQPERQDSGSKYVEEFVSGLKRLPKMASKARLKVRKSRRQGTFDSSHNSSIVVLHRDHPSLPRLRVANPDVGTPDSPRPIEIASLRDMISPIPSPHLIPLPPSPTISMDSGDERVHVQESITPRSSPGNQSNARLEPVTYVNTMLFPPLAPRQPHNMADRSTTLSASLPRTRFALPLVSEDSDESEYMNVDSRLPIPNPDYHARRFSPPFPHYSPSSRPYVTVDPSRPPIPLPNAIFDYARFSPRPSHSSSSNHPHATVDQLSPVPPQPRSRFGRIWHFLRRVNHLPWVSSRVTVQYIPGSSHRGRYGPGRRQRARAVTSWYGHRDRPRASATSLSFSSSQSVHHPNQSAIPNPIPTPISPISRTDTPEVVDRPHSPRSWIAKEPNATLISPPSTRSQKFMTRYIEKDDDSRSHDKSRSASDNSVPEIKRLSRPGDDTDSHRARPTSLPTSLPSSTSSNAMHQPTRISQLNSHSHTHLVADDASQNENRREYHFRENEEERERIFLDGEERREQETRMRIDTLFAELEDRVAGIPLPVPPHTGSEAMNQCARNSQQNGLSLPRPQSEYRIPQMKKHDSLYFYDGNVALIVLTATGEPLVFRVHKSILSRSSLVFANMFLESQGDGETHDGVPVFRVSEDAGKMESLLNVLYHPEYLTSSSADSTLLPPISRWRLSRPPSDMIDILTMVNKYKLHDLRRSIALHLQGDWPQTLAEWDLAEAEFSSMDALSSQDGNEALRASYMHLDDWYPEPVSAIRIARECDLPSILPAAFYHLSRLSAVNDNLGQRQQGPPQFVPGRRSARWDDLSAKDLLCLIKGRENIAQTDLNLTFSDDCGCGGRDPCIGLKNCGLVEDINRERARTPDVLALLRSYADLPDYGERICAQCCAFMKSRLRKARRVLWVQLPDLFQLSN